MVRDHDAGRASACGARLDRPGHRGAGDGWRSGMAGTIVYVHGASDRGAAVDAHVASIREALARQGARWDVIAARWGDAAGPTLGRILETVPEGRPRSEGVRPATTA